MRYLSKFVTLKGAKSIVTHVAYHDALTVHRQALMEEQEGLEEVIAYYQNIPEPTTENETYLEYLKTRHSTVFCELEGLYY